MNKMTLAKMDLLNYANVEGVATGYKIKRGKRTKTLAILVYVSKKLSENVLEPRDVIPKAVNISGQDVKTDVIQTGKFKALALIDDGKPVKPGYSIGHRDITAGTLGFFAKRNGETHLISNAHVLANTNKGKIGDPIYYPGPHDGGTSLNTISHLAATIPIKMVVSSCPVANACVNTFNFLARLFNRNTRLVEPINLATNKVDNAAGALIKGLEIDEKVYKIGKPTGIKEAELEMRVKKSSRTTEYTKGKITGVDAMLQVSYGEQGVAVFENQLISDIPSAGGDSGAAVFEDVDENNNLVGLLFAGGEGITVMNKIQTVFDELNISL